MFKIATSEILITLCVYFQKKYQKINKKSKKNLPTAASILKTMDHNQVIYMVLFLANRLAKNGSNN